MNPKFRPLTRREMFYGVTPKTNLLSGGTLNSTGLTSKVASTPINQTFISPTPNVSINTDVIAQHQIGFVLTNFLCKYKWEIGTLLVIGGIVVYAIHEEKKKEKQKNQRINSPQKQNNYSIINP